MSELTNIHARAVKDLTTPTELPANPDALDQVKLVAGNFPAEYAGNEAMTVGVIKELAAQGREAELEDVIQQITEAENNSKEYVDNQLSLKAPQATTYTKAEVDTALSLKAPQATTYTKAEVDTTFAAYVGGRKAYTTLALAQAAQSSLPANTAIEVTNDPTTSNNGTYQWNGTTLTKSVYDPLTQAKNYTDDTVKNRTVLSGSANGTELAIFTDKNGRRTWIEVAADGGLTERTKEYVKDAVLVPVKDAVLVPVNSTNFSYAVTDKNGRVLSAIYKDGSVYPKQITAPTTTPDSNKQFKILAIGNSFTQDAFTYVPALLKEMGYVDFELVILSFSGSTLEQHVQFATNNTVQYDMEIYNTQTNKWSGTGEYTTTFKQAITYTNFDTIILQQQSARSHNYDTYQPHLNNLIRYIYDNIDYPTKLGWHGSPAQPDYGWVSTMTSAEFYAAQQQTFLNVLRDTPIEYVIPNGTAIQNARTTTLSTLGTGGSMTQDGLHLQEGIPCLVAAYAVTLKLLEVLKLKGSIFNSSIAPTDAWIATQNIQGQNGTSVGVNQDNLFIAQKCAIAAIKKPTEVSTIN